MVWKPQRSIGISPRRCYIWSTLAVALTLTIIFLTRKTGAPRPLNVDLSKLNELSFDDRYNGEALVKYPMSERKIGSKIDDVFQYGCRDPLVEAENPRTNSAFVVLARNSEIDGVILSMRSLERRFNQWFNYPWIFLNDEKFSAEFKKRVLEVASGRVKFGLIPKSKWNFKEAQSDPILFDEAIDSQGDRSIMYGNMKSYHSMCRFYSGYFFEHPLVKNLDWYWRVEPDVDFYCDLTYDPFVEMEKHGKKYGYTIAIKELVNTVPSLFRRTKQFVNENNIQLPDSWNLFSTNHRFFKGKNENQYNDVKDFNGLINKLELKTPYNLAINYLKLSNNKNNNNNNENENENENENYKNNNLLNLKNFDKNLLTALVKHSTKKGLKNSVHEVYDGEEYNLCHFWSNFEIASNELFTSPEYKQYYDFLESTHGFFTERWGDAPIHSLAAGLFLNLSEIHYFRDIGYKHSTLAHCPYNSPNQLPYKEGPNFKHQVLPEDEIYYANYDKPASNNIGASGCRCRCPDNHKEIENSGGSCTNLWAKLIADDIPLGKKSQRDNFSSIGKLDRGSLGVNEYLDLDKIEEISMGWLLQWINDGKKFQNWKFSKEERDILRGIIK
ncbi:putative mannosyltransferase [Martiniozyma asiatica (nom. inval.)]|nr:putative mannosyltransferase [Martiniozyma asiatica]